MNTELLDKVVQHVTEVPARLAMNVILVKKLPGTPVAYDQLYRTVPTCGTVGCLAGWTLELSHLPVNEDDPNKSMDLAAGLLGLESIESRRLFFVSQWPKPFRFKYIDAQTMEEKAEVLKARVEYFKNTEGE